jgi:hypothetical protein
MELTRDIIFGIAAVITVGITFYAVWKNGKNLESAIAALAEAASQTQANDLIEKAMTSVVPRETLDAVIAKLDTGAAFIEQFTPDQIDKLIESFKVYAKSLIDGKPNDVTVSASSGSTITVNPSAAATSSAAGWSTPADSESGDG